ncbi:hypothetical protein M427DRAFT_50763 [Gonapodya prolifera JEL478]|uniref:Dihydrolipoamide acetyltransferase component of pyruvate dehydrogenase complex n=1 Tax=Gonapodya prolifera (strain JEL478) TaxID=1344416 RepID=A0A139B0H3_GONPJ|nr:hypothetical protein M427DRAFT_50763 [Gonapodya prolifera JEL478]|eukprot:KXS22440.1 hypothetical protein M427DRAFT_50763 [Gonapodya prolifera JEL478]
MFSQALSPRASVQALRGGPHSCFHAAQLSARVPSAASIVQNSNCRARLTLDAVRLSRQSRVMQYKSYRLFHSTVVSRGVIPFHLADIGEGIQECEIVQWYVKEGDRIQMFDKLCEVQSDKATVEITSRYDGVVKKLHHKVGEMAKVGQPLCDIETASAQPTSAPAAASSVVAPAPKREPVKPAAPPSTPTAPVAPAEDGNAMTFATPAVRRVAKENGVDLRQISGSGKDGRILKEDVFAYIEAQKGGSSAVRPLPLAQTASAEIPTTPVPLTPLQKSMFKNMSRSLQIPHFLYSDDVYTDNLTQLRSSINKLIASEPKKHSMEKTSYMPILVKALSAALVDFPLLNAQLVTAADDPTDVSKAKLQYRSIHNVGFAMDSPLGLVVPVIKDVQNKSVLEVATEMYRLTELGKAGQIPPADFSGATITISNIGNIGGGVVSPVIPPDTLVIGGVGKIRRIPVVEESEGDERISIKSAMTVSFSADHRVVDGATVARFVSRWKAMLEDVGMLVSGLR